MKVYSPYLSTAYLYTAIVVDCLSYYNIESTCDDDDDSVVFRLRRTFQIIRTFFSLFFFLNRE